MADYRYLLRDVLTGDLMGEVPFESATYSDVLNSPGAFSGSLGLQQPAKLEAVLMSALDLMDDGRLTLFVERDGVLVWGGFLWTSDCDLETGACTLNGEGYLSYFRRRLLALTLTYTGVDQTLIAKDLIDIAQGGSSGNIGVVTSAVTASGVLRDRGYGNGQTQWIGELIEQLASVEGGFLFRFEPQWNGNTPEVRFLTQYPASGRATDYIFEVGSNTTKARIQRDATTIANRVLAVGATPEGSDRTLTTVAWNADAVLDQSPYQPLLEDVVTFSDVNVIDTLRAHANQRIVRGKKAVVMPDIDVDPTAVPTFGSYFIGDNVKVRGEVGIEKVDDTFLITERSVTVDDAGSENASLTFAKLELFS